MPLSTQDLQDIIINDAARIGNDPALMLALADQESGGFNPNALSPTGVRGLFQVTNATGKAYGQTPQTRSDPRVSSEAGQRHFKDLLFKANGDVPTALRWYNGGSDPQFAQRVQAKVAGHQARLGQTPSTDAIVQELYGPTATPAAPTAAAPPSTEAIVQELYGPAPATPAPAPFSPTGTPGVQPARWRVTIDAGGGTPPDQVEVPGPWQDAVDVVTQLKGQYRAGTQFDIGPVPTEASPRRPEPSNPALATTKAATTDLPLEESLNPLELGISGYGAKVGLGAAKYFWPTAGKFAKLGAQALGLEAGHKVNQATGQTPGSILDFGWPDVANFATPYVQEGVVQTGKGLLRAGRAGQAVKAADQATAAQNADYARQVAADRTRLMPDASLPPVTSPPPPVQPTLAPDQGGGWRHIKELGAGAFGALVSGHPKTAILSGAGLAVADKSYDAFSRWLLSPTPSRLLQGRAPLEVFREAIGPSGQLDPRKMAVLSELFQSGQEPESPAP